MRGFNAKEARYLIIGSSALVIIAVLVVSIAAAVRSSRKARNVVVRPSTNSVAPASRDLIVPQEYTSVVPLEWSPLIDLHGEIPDDIIQRYRQEIYDIDLDTLRRKTDEAVQESFESVP